VDAPFTQISTVTGNVSGAGTDANVFIIVYGERGDTGEQKLSKSATYRDKFERGHTDVFEVEAVDLGELKSVKIWHDNKFFRADWYLERVEVEVRLTRVVMRMRVLSLLLCCFV
jgi:hypothetical protein